MIFLHSPCLLKKLEENFICFMKKTWRETTTYPMTLCFLPRLFCSVMNSCSLSKIGTPFSVFFHVKRKPSYPSSFLTLERHKHSFPSVSLYTFQLHEPWHLKARTTSSHNFLSHLFIKYHRCL